MSETGEVEQTSRTRLDKPDEKPSGMSRRQFLKGAAFAAAALAVPTDPITTMSTIGRAAEAVFAVKEPTAETSKKAGIGILDMFGQGIEEVKRKALDGHFQGRPYDEEEILARMGVKDFASLVGLKEALPVQGSDGEFVFMLNALSKFYGEHGEGVARIRENAAKLLGGANVPVDRLSAASAVKIGDISHDEIGNPVLYFDIDPAEVGRLVKENNQPVVNLSLEAGRLGMKFSFLKREFVYDHGGKLPQKREFSGGVVDYFGIEGNEITKSEYDRQMAEVNERIVVNQDKVNRDFEPQDGYVGDWTYENLSNMAKIARDNPEKMIVAAAGNPNRISREEVPRLEEARKRLAEEGNWPENLIMVGAIIHDSEWEGPGAIGADIYVDEPDLEKLEGGSTASYATAVVSEIVNQLWLTGYRKPGRIKEELEKMSNNTALPGDPKRWVLDFSKVVYG